jgi:hypothetical protein
VCGPAETNWPQKTVEAIVLRALVAPRGGIILRKEYRVREGSAIGPPCAIMRSHPNFWNWRNRDVLSAFRQWQQ